MELNEFRMRTIFLRSYIRRKQESKIILWSAKFANNILLYYYGTLKVLFVCLVGFITSSSTTRLYRGRAPRQERLTILRAATHETELGDHDFCLSRSHYTDTDPTCRERAATAGIEPGTSSPGVARSTAVQYYRVFKLCKKYCSYFRRKYLFYIIVSTINLIVPTKERTIILAKIQTLY